MQQRFDAGAHALDECGRGGDEICRINAVHKSGGEAFELNVCARGARQIDLGLFDLQGQPVAVALADQACEAVQLLACECVAIDVLQVGPGPAAVGGVDGVPGGELKINTGRDVRAVFHQATVAQQWHHAVKAEHAVKVGATDVHSRIAKQIFPALVALRTFG